MILCAALIEGAALFGIGVGFLAQSGALSLEKEGKLQDAEVEFVAYLATDPPESSRKYAERCLKFLREQL